ncbi:MAG: BatD family protein, partial [Alphaproteobacteria bacterium]|nr:BatD family protein [Alphaproteobacteria bacterium]
KKSGKLQTPLMRINGTYAKRDFSNNTMQGRFRNMSNSFGLGGDDLFDMFFVTPQPISFASEPLDIEVKAIPAEYGNEHWLPATALSVSAQWSEKNQQFKVGETVAREITITAAGVMPEQLPEPSFGTNEAWKQYPETPQLNSIVHDGEVISQAVVRVVYIPQKGGEYTLPEIRVPWFNVKTGKAEIAVVKAEKVMVKGEDIEVAVTKEDEQDIAENQLSTAINQPQNLSEAKTAEAKEAKWIWLALVAGAFVIGGILSYAVFGRNSRTTATTTGKAESLKDIEKYLKSEDYRALRNALIAFGSKENNSFAVNNLNDLAKLVNQAEFAAQMELLNGILYAGKQASLDDEIIIKSLKNMHKNNATASNSKPLPELYK